MLDEPVVQISILWTTAYCFLGQNYNLSLSFTRFWNILLIKKQTSAEINTYMKVKKQARHRYMKH